MCLKINNKSGFFFYLLETEEGFIKLFTKPANEVSDGDTTPSAEEKEIADVDTPPSELDSIHNLRLLLKVCIS